MMSPNFFNIFKICFPFSENQIKNYLNQVDFREKEYWKQSLVNLNRYFIAYNQFVLAVVVSYIHTRKTEAHSINRIELGRDDVSS